jgi:hypothetical protein
VPDTLKISKLKKKFRTVNYYELERLTPSNSEILSFQINGSHFTEALAL